MSGFLGAGDLYINRIVGNVAQGWEGPFAASKFEIKADSELREQTSRGRYTYGQISESVAIPKPFDLNVEMDSLDKTGLSLALMGTAAAAPQTSGTITDEAVTASLGKWSVLSKANFTGALTVKNTAGSTTYVEGTDYIVNRSMGWIQPVTGGAITDAQPLKVSGAYGAITADMTRGATQTSVRAQFRLDGVNMATGLASTVDVWDATIASKAAVDFLADKFNTIPLTGRMKTPAGKTEPFTITQRTA